MNNFLRNDGKKMMIQKGKNPIRIVLGHNGLASLKPASTTALGQWREELVIMMAMQQSGPMVPL